MLGYGRVTDTSEGGVTIEILESKLHELLRILLAQVDVDEGWYRTTYRDVDAAIRSGDLRSARDHYVNAGYFENRLPRPIKVDETWYLQTYPDVAVALKQGVNSFNTAKEHFEMNGYQEGRLPCAGWSLLAAPKPRIVRAVA
jgi:hypothetical protein